MHQGSKKLSENAWRGWIKRMRGSFPLVQWLSLHASNGKRVASLVEELRPTYCTVRPRNKIK